MKQIKKITTILLLLFLINIIYSYNFELYADNTRAKSSTCELRYDNIYKNLSFEKEDTVKKIKKEINSNISLVCTDHLTIVHFKLFNDNRDLVYSETVIATKSYSYDLDVKEIELELSQDNICNIRTGSHIEKYKFNEGDDLDIEFVDLFSISCESSLEGSTLRLFDKDNYNIKYKIFEEDEKSLIIDLSKQVTNYKNKVELYLIPYSSKDNFKCKTSNNEKNIEFKNSDNKLIISKTFYTTDDFKLSCDYNFKQIQVFVDDSYIDKELNSFDYYNISNLNIKLTNEQIKPLKESKIIKKEVIKKKVSIKKNKTIIKRVESVVPLKTNINNSYVEIEVIKKVGFFRSILNWLLSDY